MKFLDSLIHCINQLVDRLSVLLAIISRMIFLSTCILGLAYLQSLSSCTSNDILVILKQVLDLPFELCAAKWTVSLYSEPLFAAVSVEVVLLVAWEYYNSVFGVPLLHADCTVWHLSVLQIVFFIRFLHKSYHVVLHGLLTWLLSRLNDFVLEIAIELPCLQRLLLSYNDSDLLLNKITCLSFIIHAFIFAVHDLIKPQWIDLSDVLSIVLFIWAKPRWLLLSTLAHLPQLEWHEDDFDSGND